MELMEQEYTNYIGPSMNPLLVDGDGLHIVPYKDRTIRPGDVVVFIRPGGETKIVHRIVSVDAKGIRTRGDNAPKVDPWMLTPDHILGRVTYIQRKNRRRSIAGGFVGQLEACSFRCTRLFDTIVSFLLRPAYRKLYHLASLRKTLHGILKPRVLSFGRPEGMELQLVVGRCLIGRRLPGEEHWEIRRPFRLCVDEELLPRPTPTEVTVPRGW
jgi:signal peptidase